MNNMSTPLPLSIFNKIQNVNTAWWADSNGIMICHDKICEGKHKRLRLSFEFLLFSSEQKGTAQVLNIVKEKHQNAYM